MLPVLLKNERLTSFIPAVITLMNVAMQGFKVIGAGSRPGNFTTVKTR